MFDNPQQEVKNMSKKLRPIKLSDEEFELFYKEIYAEFGPKDVPPVDLNPQVKEVVPEPVAEEVPKEPVEEEVPQEVPAEAVHEEVQENSVKAAAVICDVQEDEVMDEDMEMEEIPVPKKKKGVTTLVVVLCLEALAIAGVAAYWLLLMR